MFYIFLHIWPWVLAALALGAFTGIFAGRLTVQPLPLPRQRTESKKVVAKEKEKDKEPGSPPPVAAPTPAAASDQIDDFQKQLATRDAAIADLRAGLDREVALRRAAIARLEGMMVEQQAQAPARPKGKASAKSSPSN